MIKLLKLFLIALGSLVILIAAVFFIFPEQPPQETLFGITFSKQQAENFGLDWRKSYTDILDDLDVKYIRLSAYWTEIEAKRGEFNFEILDWQIEEAKKRDAKILLAIGRKLPRWPECHIPSWAIDLSREAQNQAVQEMLEEVIAHYKNEPAIWAWQVENEPFFPFGECPWVDKNFLKKEEKDYTMWHLKQITLKAKLNACKAVEYSFLEK
jgi:beta-galactosidase GanA